MTLLEAAHEAWDRLSDLRIGRIWIGRSKEDWTAITETRKRLASGIVRAEQIKRKQEECKHIQQFVLYDGNHVTPEFCFKCGKELCCATEEKGG